MGAKSSKGSRSRSRRGSANSCALQKRAYSNCRYRNISSQRSLQSLIASVRTLESQYRVKINRKNYLTGAIKKLEIEIRRLRDSYEALKSVCMSADANTKKNKKEQLEMLSGRYLDRINLLEAQKNVLNKQSSLLSSKIDASISNKADIGKMDNELAVKSRMTLYAANTSSKNTVIIWFLKQVAYILCLCLVLLILKQL